MIFFIALIPATMLTIAGYFVLYLASRSEGGFRSFGKYLGFWAFTLAGLVVLGAVSAAAHGGRGGMMFGMQGMQGMQGMHRGFHGAWRGEGRYFEPREARPGSFPRNPDGAPDAPAPSASPPPAR
jgi:hypothetical protein